MDVSSIIQFKECLMPLYAHMIQVVLDSGFGYDTAKFCMQWGKDFPQGENEGLLFYGRANNGWISSSNDVEELFADGGEDCIFARDNQMEWMAEDVVDDYRPSSSAFIRTIKNVASEYYDNWTSHVAWSNLYKVAPWEGGNPSDALCYAQLEDCKKIMQKELAFTSPRAVVMLTGYYWAKDFLEYMNDGLEPDCIGYEKWGGYEAWAYRLEGRLLIVSEHPQGKPEAAHVIEINNN